MARYDKDKVIGSGTFGNVWLVKSKLSRQTYVLKEVSLNSLSKSEQQQALNEVSVLAKCVHKHIVRYKDAVQDYEQNILSIVMEYADGGDLYAAIIKQNGVPFSEHRVIKWFMEICLALQYIHHKNILHRDLKSQNVFLTRSKVIKIGDFGISRILKGPEELAKTAIGTPYYLSPEICQRKHYNYKSDIWALGCLLFEMAALEHAFQAQDFFHLMTLILNGKRRELPRHCSTLLRDLISSLLCIDPDERPSTGEILAYPSLQTYLSEYMITENVRENTLMTTNEINAKKVLPTTIKDSTKRRASISALNPKETKRYSPGAESEQPRFKYLSNVRSGSNKKPTRPSPETRTDILRQKRQVTYKTPTAKIPVRNSKATKSSFTASCDTYNLLPSSSSTRSFLTKSEDAMLNNKDFGYHSKENSSLVSNNASGFATFNCKKLFSMSMFKRRSDESKVVPDNGNKLRDASSGFFDFCPISEETEIAPVHDHCQHSQCHQCVLDMLWRNRIRSNSKTSMDTEEYSKLKDKLLKVFKDLFKQVYQSLMHDWEGTDVAASKEAFRGILRSLTYEQVQSLPLMMQLIQLDLLISSRE